MPTWIPCVRRGRGDQKATVQMLKRIKVRSKLLVLILTPLIALGVFAWTGVNERLESSEFFGREEAIADLADAGADLTLAVHIERNRALIVDAGGAADIEGAALETDTAIDHWLTAAAAARTELTRSVVGQIDTFAASLGNVAASRDSADMTAVADDLLQVGRNVNSLTVVLTSQAQDLELYRAVSDYLQLSRILFGMADITTIGADSISAGEIATGDFALLRAADVSVDSGIQQFRNFAEPEYVSQFDTLVYGGVLPSADTSDPILELQFFVNRPDRTDALIEWLEQGEQRLVAVNEVSSALLQSASTSAALAATAASDEARSFVVLAGAVIVAALALAVMVGRSISRPLRRLTANAERLSNEELPALVEAMRQGTAANVAGLTPIDTRGRDEIAKLATAISDIHEVTVAVAEEQGELLRRGISDMFVNLARRNQSLLDRQIEFIDQLESDEENPDTLENLFRLDHLATRMRRNAESLLVLAGAEQSRRRGQAVEIVDVVRVAMGEIEDFSRIRMISIAPATVAGSVAVDLAHLLSELMENASQFSPPDTPVEVVGQRTEDGTYQLTVSDRGIGLSPEQLIDANHLLANPPVVGLELGRSLGFTVVSRLAHRLGISARLTSSTPGGVTAIVSIPAEMTGRLSSDEPVAETPDALHATGLAAASSEPIGLPDGTTAAQAMDLGLGSPARSTAEPDPVFGDDPLFDLGVGPSGSDPSHGGQDPFAGTPSPASSSGPDKDQDKGDMFDGIGSPAVEKDRADSSDIFASLDKTTPPGSPSALPQRTPGAAAPDLADASPASTPGTEASGLPQRRPESTLPPPAVHSDSPSSVSRVQPETTQPESAARESAEPESTLPPPQPSTQLLPLEPVEHVDVPVETPVRSTPASSVGAVDAAVTSAGLIRRTPRTGGPGDDTSGESTASSVRSPEEVRQMLSRYRTGLRRGRETPTS